jgi:hypothetical protein
VYSAVGCLAAHRDRQLPGMAIGPRKVGPRPKRDIKQSTSDAQKRSPGSHAREHCHGLNVPRYAAMAIMSPWSSLATVSFINPELDPARMPILNSWSCLKM